MNLPALMEANHRILVIDDNEAIHDDMRKILAPASDSAAGLADDEAFLFGTEATNLTRFEVDSAYQGQEGLEKVRLARAEGRPYAVAFVDIRMPPGWDGVETIAQIQQVDPALQSVICTAYSDYSWTEIHKRLGHSDSLLILKKPFDNVEVTQLAYALSRKWLVTRQAEARMEDLDRLVAERTAELRESQQRLERELAERTAAQQAFQTIFESGPLGIGLLDADGRYADANRALEELYQLSKPEFLGRRAGDLALAEDGTACRCQEEMCAKGSIDAMEVHLSRRPGGPVTALVWGRSIQIGQRPHYLMYMLDITERRRMEEELRRAREAAEEAARLKGEFLANVSHEIRTPMNGILGFTQLTLASDLSIEQREYLEAVETSAKALLDIINDILDFSKMEAGRADLDHVPFSLRECLESTRQGVVTQAQQKGLDLIVKLSPEAPPELIGDPGKLRQVLLNLLGNAVKFTERGAVELSVTPVMRHSSSARLRFAVRDTGIGIAAGKQAFIFEPFRQADGSVTRKYGGTGLGLAISSRLVRLMGGQIGVESEIGHGSTFYFVAEFALATPGLRNVSQSTSEEASESGLSILVVDDNPLNQTLASRLLIKHGHRVQTASNGVEAIAHFDRQRFDMVLMDLQMPEMDGFQALAEIRRREGMTGRHIPVVAMTAHAMKGERERCLQAGMDSYLSKPYQSKDLLGLVAEFGRAG
jgi:PAS domain S-box-containing protein